MFNASQNPMETRQETRESIKRNDSAGLRENSMDVRAEQLRVDGSWQALQKLIEDKKQLRQLQKLHISLIKDKLV